MTDSKKQKSYFDNLHEDYKDEYDNPTGIISFEKHERLNTALSFANFTNLNRAANIGVGSGEFFSNIPVEADFESIGVDFSRSMIKTARERNPQFPFLQGSIDYLPFKDSSIDLVFCLGVIGYLDRNQVKKAIKEISRITKPDGQVILSFANSNSPFRRFRQFYYYKFLEVMKKISGLGTPVDHMYKSYSPSWIKKHLEEASFKIEDKRYHTYSTGIWNRFPNKKMYHFLEKRYKESDSFGRLAMTWVLDLRKKEKKEGSD